MSNRQDTSNDTIWKRLFAEYDILNRISVDGQFVISASQIKKFREPRLMVKFDHTVNLPKIFSDHGLAILPITRGDYVISHFDAYHKFEPACTSSEQVSLPDYIQSLDASNITTETVALNCAFASGIIANFLEDEELLATVSGRMGTGTFDFEITNLKKNAPCKIQVSNSQIEIDAAYEGIHGLTLFEAKRVLADDFLVRQLYYPYRVWQKCIQKPVRTVYLVYSNGIFHLYEYCFQNPGNYNSLVLVKQGIYSIEDTEITIADIQQVLATTVVAAEPDIPFPQADNFDRVINLCELLAERELTQDDITEQYAFDIRQTNYYADAARYLGLVQKKKNESDVSYELTETGKQVQSMKFRQRQLMYCRMILSHKVFHDTLRQYFDTGNLPAKSDIIQFMKTAGLYKVESDSTYERRSATVKEWINWISGLIR